jgi:hypothetical protein
MNFQFVGLPPLCGAGRGNLHLVAWEADDKVGFGLGVNAVELPQQADRFFNRKIHAFCLARVSD